MKKHTRLALCLFFITGGLGSAAAAPVDTLVSKTPQNRAVLLEEYTGMMCVNCPDGHRIANNIAEDFAARYPGRFHAINIHTSNLAAPPAGEPDFRTQAGDILADNAGINSLPSGVINRHAFQGNSTVIVNRAAWETYAMACAEMPAYANIAGRASFDWQTRELSVEVQVFFTDDAPVEANHIHVALIQDNIEGYQKGAKNNPSQYLGGDRYNHQHALRDFLTAISGDEVPEAKQGDFISRIYTKILPERIRNIELRPDDLSVIVFLTEDNNEVINVDAAPIVMQNGPGHLFAFHNGRQVSHRSCDADVRAAFQLENRTYEGEPISEIGFRVQSDEAETAEFTIKIDGAFGYGDLIDLVSDPFPLPRLNTADTVEISIGSVNGKPYAYEEQKTLRLPVAKYTAYTSEPVVEVHIWQDRYGSETQWTFQNEAGAVLASGGPYDNLSFIGTLEHTVPVTLQEGCHTFKITDAEGDGIHNVFGEGHFSLNTPDGAVLAENDGRFGDSALVFIKKTGVANERRTDESVEVVLTPNPAKDRLRISCRHEITAVRIFNLTGKEMPLTPAGLGTTDFQCPLNGFATGIYFARITTAGGTVIAKFVVR